jgi:hypothetical protein
LYELLPIEGTENIKRKKEILEEFKVFQKAKPFYRKPGRPKKKIAK